MAKREYPQDEFDDLKAGVPVGSHRRTPRAWTRLLALVATVAVAAGAGYGAVWVLFNRGDIPVVRDLFPAAEGPSQSAFVTATPSMTASETPSESPSPSPSEVINIQYGLPIRVSNASGVEGLAAKIRDIAVDDGFTGVTIANWDGVVPPGSVIRYDNGTSYETAAYLGELLNIGLISEGDTDGVSIQVILRSDPLPEPSPSATSSESPSP